MTFNPQMYLVDDIDTAWKLKSWLGERREHSVLGLDTETSGLNAFGHDSRLRTIQIGDHQTGWTIPWEQWGGVAVECLNSWKGDLALHNAPFDHHWLKRFAGYTLPWDRVYDTELMARLAGPKEPKFGLKELSVRYVDPRANAEKKQLAEIFKKHGWGWDTIPINVPTYWMYAALDPVFTCHLYTQFPAHKIFPETFEMEMAALRITSNMEYVGMRVDVDYSKEMYEKTTAEVEYYKQWCQDTHGFQLTSTQQVAAYIKRNWGDVFTVFTEKGAPSVDKKQLEKFSASEDRSLAALAKFITMVKGKEKVANSYFKNFVEMNSDGFVHPSIKTMGARTGRMSVTNPALQTIPSGGAEVRNAFLPHNDEHIIVSSDYSQMELRLLAHFSDDKPLQNAFIEADATGGDFFTNLGSQIYGAGFSKDDPRRKLVKSTMYGLIYGAGPQKMAETAGIPVSEMKPVSDAVHEAFPGIKTFMKSVEQMGNQRARDEGDGYIITGTGRKIPCDDGKIYTLVNYLLQGTGAELLKKALIRLDAAGFSEYLRMPIHDEIIFSMPNDVAKDALPEIEELMSYKGGQFAVDQLAEPEIAGRTWGAKYE